MMIAGSFSQTWFFLQQESYLTATCIGGGLTAVRRVDRKGKGEWYSAFFQLSIGLERLMKAIIIVDHINRGQLASLTRKILRDKYGHDLLTLFDSVGAIGVSTSPNPASVVSKTSTGYAILEFLSNFADQARYHNLDSLVSAPTGTDPLTGWKAIVDRILAEDVTARRLKKVQLTAKRDAAASSPLCAVISHTLDKKPMTLQEMLENGPVQNEAARFVVFHLLEIIRPLVECLSDLCHASYYVPTSDVRQVA